MAEGSEQNFEYEGAHLANEKYATTEEARHILSGPEGKKTLEAYEDNARLTAELERVKAERNEATEKAGRDKLTGLYNRRHMEEYLEGLIKEGLGFAVIEIDVDHFKRVNDEFGHAEGDKVLKWLADRLRSGSPDEVGRWGGEEFLIVIKNPKNIHEVLIEAERLRSEVEEFSEKSVRYAAQDPERALPTEITISAGCAFNRPEDVPPADYEYKSDETKESKIWQEVVKRADVALYKSKEKRNEVTFNDMYLPDQFISTPKNV